MKTKPVRRSKVENTVLLTETLRRFPPALAVLAFRQLLPR
jgi:hypothetical protein